MYSSFVRRLTSGVMLVTGMQGTAAHAQTEAASEPRRLFVDGEEQAEPRRLFVDGEVTCGLKCPRLNHFQFGLRTFLSERLSLQLGWDPGHVEKPTWEDTDDRLGQRLPPRRTWFDRYALRFRASDAVEVSLENWNAATLIPDASGLSFAHALQDSGWNQTALRISVIDTDRPANSWTVIAGLGEGERFKDRDHKPYLALMLRREWSEGLEWQGAYSIDPDSLEEENFYWLPSEARAEASQGFKSERQALSLVLTGQNRKARGLRASVGLQKNVLRGPKTPAAVTAVDPVEGPFDLTEILAEHWGMSSEIEKRTFAFSASYLILAEYLLAFHHQDLDVKLGGGARARACSGLDQDGRCLDTGTDHARLRLREDTFGMGYISGSGFSLFLENFSVKYDRLYELYHFAPGQDKRQRGQSFTQVRLTWNW